MNMTFLSSLCVAQQTHGCNHAGITTSKLNEGNYIHHCVLSMTMHLTVDDCKVVSVRHF